jgi:DNA-binding beta-propeller fold protein YncE
VNCFSPTGHLLAQWGQRGTNAGQFMLPRAVAVNSHDEIYVSEYGVTERVQRFALGTSASRPANLAGSELAGADGGISSGSDSTTGQFLNSFGHAGNQPGELNRAEGLFVDRSGQLYVADSCNHRIEIFSREGNFIRAYGKAGSGKGELSYPYDICVDGAGRQYVCEFGNSRIQVFDAQDQPIEIIGGPGAGPGQFSNPWSIALDSAGNLYVADALNHRVQKLIRKQ